MRKFIGSVRVGWIAFRYTWKYLRAGLDVNMNITGEPHKEG